MGFPLCKRARQGSRTGFPPEGSRIWFLLKGALEGSRTFRIGFPLKGVLYRVPEEG